MKIGIIDADLIGRKKHRFPNLVCEKLSGFWKEKGADVHLLLSYEPVKILLDVQEDSNSQMQESTENADVFDEIYISKVFTDTPVPDYVLSIVEKMPLHSRVHIGGTGFYFDKAPNLPDEIEHHMPDYSLYDEWIQSEVIKAQEKAAAEQKKFNPKSFLIQFKEYTDYSIGFITRGCFRKCAFCVNKKYSRVFKHSPLDEFFDQSRKKICLLDDNFFGCAQWKPLLQELIDTGRQFKFKQGLDERLLTEEKCEMLFSANYDGDYTFAFDNVGDYELIHEKLKLIRKYSGSKNIKFYVLTGFESTDASDIENAFKRIALLMRYGCLPYLMRYQNKNETPWKKSKYSGLYVTLARWCNQPSIFKKMSFRYFCEANQALHKNKDTLCSSMKAMVDFEQEHPEIAALYFDLWFEKEIERWNYE